jgi:hypothetical protein
VNKSEFERHVRENLRLTEVAPGRWVGKVPIAGLPIIQPFPIFLFQTVLERRDGTSATQPSSSAVAVGIKPPLKISRDDEGVLEYLLRANATSALGAFVVTDDGELVVSAEMPCGSGPESYFSREELDLMVGSVMAMVRSHYVRVLQLVHADEPHARRGILETLGIKRPAPNDAGAGA